MDDADPDIVTLLRVTARAAPPSNAVTRLNDQARDMLVAAADEIERLRQKDEVNNDIIGMLMAQLRILGHIPCVVESDEVGKAELKMRAAARGNAN